MGKQETRQIEIVVNIVVVLSLVFLCFYGIQSIYGFSILPDEFGYWASAAKLLSYDWSEVASIGSYYSFGYSLLLAPILFLFKDAVMAYRAAIIVNLSLQVISFFFIKNILKRLFENTEEILVAIIAGMAVLYPSWVFYTQTTMSESLLFFMFVLVTWFMINYLDRPSVINGILLGISAVYIYAVHMRTIGVLVAVILMVCVVVLMSFMNKEPGEDRTKVILSALVTLAIIIAGFVLCIAIKNHLIDALYSSGIKVRASSNDYSGQTGKLRDLLTLNGIGDFFISMAGKILYLGCATFGLAYVGIYALIRRGFRLDKKAMFLLLAAAFEFGVMCIYLMHSAGENAKRYDLFLHGRYFDFVIPLLMAVGVFELLIHEKYIRKTVISLAVMAISMLLSLWVCSYNKTGMPNQYGVLMIGMSYFLDDESGRLYYPIICSVILAVVVMAVLIGFIAAYKKNKNGSILIVLPILMIALGYHACNHMIYVNQSGVYGDLQAADITERLLNDGNYNQIVVLYVNGLEYADALQLKLRDHKIHIEYVDKEIIGDDSLMESYVKNLTSDNLYLMDLDSPLIPYLEQTFSNDWKSGHFGLFYD